MGILSFRKSVKVCYVLVPFVVFGTRWQRLYHDRGRNHRSESWKTSLIQEISEKHILINSEKVIFCMQLIQIESVMTHRMS